jgi:hypothetical protein
MSVKSPAKRVGNSLFVWTVTLGVAGFLAGFLGPLIVNPDANQGPLLGIFITGPGGALAGLLLGAVSQMLPMSEAIRGRMLVACVLTLVLGTLYVALPGPRILGNVIDAEVTACSPTGPLVDDAIRGWEQQVARAGRAPTSAAWREAAREAIAGDAAVVITMRVSRRVPIFEQRKPWNRGRKIAGVWTSVDSSERFYATDTGGDCAVSLRRKQQLYMPFSNVTYESPSKSWPTTDPAAFLSLMELGPVPPDVRGVLP